MGRIVMHAHMPVLLHRKRRRLEWTLQYAQPAVARKRFANLPGYGRHEIGLCDNRRESKETGELEQHVAIDSMLGERFGEQRMTLPRQRFDMCRRSIVGKRHRRAEHWVVRTHEADEVLIVEHLRTSPASSYA